MNLGHRPSESSRMCGKCKRELPATPKYFRPRNDRVGGLAYTCRECARRYHKPRSEDGDGAPRKGGGCFQCEGLPWRRPEDGTPCKCSGVYEPEPPVTLSYGAAWTTDRTTYPSSGGME